MVYFSECCRPRSDDLMEREACMVERKEGAHTCQNQLELVGRSWPIRGNWTISYKIFWWGPRPVHLYGLETSFHIQEPMYKELCVECLAMVHLRKKKGIHDRKSLPFAWAGKEEICAWRTLPWGRSCIFRPRFTPNRTLILFLNASLPMTILKKQIIGPTFPMVCNNQGQPKKVRFGLPFIAFWIDSSLIPSTNDMRGRKSQAWIFVFCGVSLLRVYLLMFCGM